MCVTQYVDPRSREWKRGKSCQDSRSNRGPMRVRRTAWPSITKCQFLCGGVSRTISIEGGFEEKRKGTIENPRAERAKVLYHAGSSVFLFATFNTSQPSSRKHKRNPQPLVLHRVSRLDRKIHELRLRALFQIAIKSAPHPPNISPTLVRR